MSETLQELRLGTYESNRRQRIREELPYLECELDSEKKAEIVEFSKSLVKKKYPDDNIEYLYDIMDDDFEILVEVNDFVIDLIMKNNIDLQILGEL